MRNNEIELSEIQQKKRVVAEIRIHPECASVRILQKGYRSE